MAHLLGRQERRAVLHLRVNVMRYRDWPTRLHETIQAAFERPFLWGEFDC
ncbi:DUF6950 family protein, partial [Pseudomonas shirazica]